MDFAGLDADLDVACAEVQLLVARGDVAALVELVGEAVEDGGVFGDDGVEGLDRVDKRISGLDECIDKKGADPRAI